MAAAEGAPAAEGVVSLVDSDTFSEVTSTHSAQDDVESMLDESEADVKSDTKTLRAMNKSMITLASDAREKALSRTASVLTHYYAWYVAYLLLIITLGTLAMQLLGDDAAFIDVLYLAVSTTSMTGLSSNDFTARPWTTHVVAWFLLCLGSPMLLSITPVVLRLRNAGRGRGKERTGGVAFFGLMTTAKDEHTALRLLALAVVLYWATVQLLGWLLLWLALGRRENAGPLLFLATSAFHNAGLVSMKSGLPYSDPCAPAALGTVMVLILCGNTCFPMILRALIRLGSSATRNPAHKRVLGLLLRYPRTCYTHLFPAYANRWLCVVTPLLVLVQILALVVSDLVLEFFTGKDATEIFAGISFGRAVLGIVFQSVSTRTAGFSVMNLALLSPTSAYVFCICMWISVSPVVVVMRSTTNLEGHGVDECSAEEVKESTLQSGHQPDASLLRRQMGVFMSDNSVQLLTLLFFILFCEEWHTSDKEVREKRFLAIVFEFCSAYGTVGLSMSEKPWSRSGEWSRPAKVLLMLVMIMGRLRGLPESIDPTFHLGAAPDRFDEELDSSDEEALAKSPQQQCAD